MIKTTIKYIAILIISIIASYLWYTYFWQIGTNKFDNPVTGIVVGIIIWGALISAWVSTEAFLDHQKSTQSANKLKKLDCGNDNKEFNNATHIKN